MKKLRSDRSHFLSVQTFISCVNKKTARGYALKWNSKPCREESIHKVVQKIRLDLKGRRRG